MIIFYNGKVYSDGEMKSALVTEGKKIVYVGDDETAKAMAAGAKSDVRMVDLNGRLMLPGFVDSHAHPGYTAKMFEDKISLSECSTKEEILQEIKDFVEQNPDIDFYEGAGWMAPVFGEAGPAKEWLDEICPDKPMVLTGLEGHSLWANSKAIEKAGITDETPQPDGGVIEKNEDGTVRGVFKEEAMKPVHAICPEPSVEAIKKGIRNYQKLMVEAGYTASTEMMFCKNDEIYQAYMELAEAGELIMKVGMSNLITPAKPGAEYLKDYANPDRKIYNRAIHDYYIKIFMDGVVEGHTAWLKEPYADDPNYCGDPIWNHDDLFELALGLDKMGYNFHMHAIGDRAAQEVADLAEYLQKNNPRDDRICVLAHAQLIKPDDIQRLADLGVTLSTDPCWFGFEKAYHEGLEIPFLGEERADSMYPMKTLFDAGIVVSAASDFNITPYPHPLYSAMTGSQRAFIDENFQPDEVYRPEERVTVSQMIQALTTNGYYSIGIADTAGKLLEGMDADLVVLSDNVLEFEDALKLLDVSVDMTVSEGDVVYEGGLTLKDALNKYVFA